MPRPELGEPDHIADPATGSVALDGADGHARGRRPRRRLIVGVLVVVLVLTVASAIVLARRLQPPADTPALVGQRAPGFVLDGLGTTTSSVALASLAGRPVVVNFWASWCVPCRTEMPALEAAHRRFGGRVAFVGVDHQDDRASAVQFVAQTGVTYESGFDAQGTVAAAYCLYGLPTTVLVSADGVVVAEVTGAATEQRLLAMIHDRLGITTG